MSSRVKFKRRQSDARIERQPWEPALMPTLCQAPGIFQLIYSSQPQRWGLPPHSTEDMEHGEMCLPSPVVGGSQAPSHPPPWPHSSAPTEHLRRFPWEETLPLPGQTGTSCWQENVPHKVCFSNSRTHLNRWLQACKLPLKPQTRMGQLA